jgi:hypothetical protein
MVGVDGWLLEPIVDMRLSPGLHALPVKWIIVPACLAGELSSVYQPLVLVLRRCDDRIMIKFPSAPRPGIAALPR